MESWSRILLPSPALDRLHQQLAEAVEQHLGSRGGVKGMAMKAGYVALRAAKPDVALRAVRALLPSMVEALQPLHEQFQQAGGGDFGDFLVRRADQAAALLLEVTDRRVATVQNTAAKSLYQRFRGSAAGELQVLLPTLGKLLQRAGH
jgi:hypothetical protein